MPYFVAEVAEQDGPSGADEQALRRECLQLHGVSWVESYVATQADRRICLFEAPDAESVRVALRAVRARFDRVWAANRLQAKG